MKTTKTKLIATCIAFFFVITCKSQGNLQFNQVISIVTDNSGPDSYTVPAGKVFKLEAIRGGSSIQVSISGKNSNLFGDPTIQSMPVWFKAGDQLNISTFSFISGIEFNIVP